jgi:hypothetical protein
MAGLRLSMMISAVLLISTAAVFRVFRRRA